MTQIIGHFAKQMRWQKRRKNHSTIVATWPKGCHGVLGGVWECDIKNVTCLHCLADIKRKVTDKAFLAKVNKQYNKMKNIRDCRQLRRVYKTTWQVKS